VDRVHRENNISIDVALVVDDTLKRLYHREAQETLTYKLPDNSNNCLHNTALGKAYLSCLSEDQLQTKIDELELTARTENTITTKERLLAELREIKRCGYAMAEEEYLPGLLAIGAPLTDPVSGRAVGAVSFDFSVLQHRKDDIESKYADQVIQMAGRLSEMLPISGSDD
jgi:DNA-binding IclR family transcriptional regulator